MRVEYYFLNTVRSLKVSSQTATTMQKRILPGETRQVKIIDENYFLMKILFDRLV